MTGREYIRKAMSHAKQIGERTARLIGAKDKQKFTRKFIGLMRYIVERRAKEWSGRLDKSKRMKASLKDIEAEAAKKS